MKYTIEVRLRPGWQLDPRTRRLMSERGTTQGFDLGLGDWVVIQRLADDVVTASEPRAGDGAASVGVSYRLEFQGFTYVDRIMTTFVGHAAVERVKLFPQECTSV